MATVQIVPGGIVLFSRNLALLFGSEIILIATCLFI